MPYAETCPVCGRDNEVNKVSTIYIHALKAKQPHKRTQDGSDPLELPALRGIDAGELAQLGKRLAPPALPRELPTRPIHPDLMVVAFSAILPAFLMGIYSSQRPLFAPMISVLVVCYGLYLWKRSGAIAKFERMKAVRKASSEAVRRGVDRWMRLYYCARDDVVFEAGSQASAPADLIAGYLVRE